MIAISRDITDLRLETGTRSQSSSRTYFDISVMVEF